MIRPTRHSRDSMGVRRATRKQERGEKGKDQGLGVSFQ